MNGGGGAAHREVEAAWKGDTGGSRSGGKSRLWRAPYASSNGGRIRKRGGDSLGGEGVRATMSPREEKGEGKGGSGMGARVGIRS